MISTTEMLIFGNAFTCALLAQYVLTNPAVWVQRARVWVFLTAAASFLCGGLGWLLARPWAVEALARGALLAAVAGCGLGALWLLRNRLRPRGFTATTRRYAKRVQRVEGRKQWEVEEL